MSEKENASTLSEEQLDAQETPQTDNVSKEESSLEEENAQPAAEKTEKKAEKEEGKSFFNRKNKKEEKAKEEIEKLEKQNKELKDKFLLLYSEFDNYKKRTNKEKLELLSTASEKVILELLPIVDDFERAIAANENVEDIQVVKDGFNLIYNKLCQMLKRMDVQEIAALGEDFNTDFHEAITHFPAQKEEDKGKVIDVTQKGYKLKDKVIRYSKVVVGQ